MQGESVPFFGQFFSRPTVFPYPVKPKVSEKAFDKRKKTGYNTKSERRVRQR